MTLISSVIYSKISAPIDTKFIGGWADEQLQKLGDSITTGIYNGFIAIMDSVCDVVFWISKAGIIGCIIVFVASHDKKSVSLGIKLILIYFIAKVVRLNI